jgi:hypothetical protein
MKVISFSLWGKDPLYTEGAKRNVALAREVYSGWVCRVHCAPDVPPDVVRELEAMGAQCPIVRHVRGPWHGLFWRFYPAGDPDVAVMLCRDTDSRLNWRERAAVDDWLTSGEPFHIMRDNREHGAVIPGGMWGVRDHFLHDMVMLLRRWRRYDAKGVDQEFLAARIWPRVCDHRVAHDPYFRLSLGRARLFPPHRSIAPLSFVGEVVDADLAARAPRIS